MASTIKVNNIQNQCGANIINESANTITIGASGDTIQLAAGASQTGFGRTGTVDWDTTAKTASFTAVSGNGYFVNTTSGAITVTLPAGSAGDIIAVRDYAQTFATNNLTVGRNGQPIDGLSNDLTLSTNGQAITLVYVDGTQGWKSVNSNETVNEIKYVAATGGTVTCCGNYKIHTFTGPGTFCVSCEGNSAGSNTVEYLVVAGGGAGGTRASGGGGGGGFRFFGDCITAPYPASPLIAPAGLTVTAQGYPITVGAGGTGNTPSNNEIPGNDGSNSIFSTITSTGGGGGLGSDPTAPGRTGIGGSGGGGSPNPGNPNAPGGSGNTPPVSPPQGNPGGFSGVNYNGGGGGGAAAAGQAAGPTPTNPVAGGGDGGIGAGFPTTHFGSGQVSSCISYFSGGGGGGSWTDFNAGPGGAGGLGGGASGVTANTQPSYPTYQANSATANTGGGGGGGGGGPISNPTGGAIIGGNGGSGIVIIRYKYQ